jgi:hypothetical protein
MKNNVKKFWKTSLEFLILLRHLEIIVGETWDFYNGCFRELYRNEEEHPFLLLKYMILAPFR